MRAADEEAVYDPQSGEEIGMIPVHGDAVARFRGRVPGLRTSRLMAIVCLLAGGTAAADPGPGSDGFTRPGPTDPAPLRFQTATEIPFALPGFAREPDAGFVWRTMPVDYDARGPLAESIRRDLGPGLLQRYQNILTEESMRRQRRNPQVFFPGEREIAIDEDLALASARYHAERIFGSTHNEILSRTLDHLVERSENLSALNERIRGIDFGIRTQATDPVAGAEAPGRRRTQDPLRINMIVSNKPRVEIKARLAGGTKASLLIPLASPGVRATISRQLLPGVRGALRAGYEDLGDEVWVAADLRFSF